MLATILAVVSVQTIVNEAEQAGFCGNIIQFSCQKVGYHYYNNILLHYRMSDRFFSPYFVKHTADTKG